MFSNRVFSPFDRAPCSVSVMLGSAPRGCGTVRRIVTSCATEGYAGRGTRQAGAFRCFRSVEHRGDVSKWPQAGVAGRSGRPSSRFIRSWGTPDVPATWLASPPMTSSRHWPPKIALLHNAEIIQCGCASLRRHNLHIPPKLPSVVVLSDDIALREGGV